MINGKLIPPPADLPVELRTKGDRGGIYFDDILLTNDSKPVFFDDFQSGDLSGWSKQNDAKVESSASKAYCLFLNFQGPAQLATSHNILVQNPGVIELSAWVWLPPASEQEFLTSTSLYRYSSGSDDNISVGVQEDSRDGYIVTLRWYRSNGDDKQVKSQGSVLKSGKWARLTLRLDKGSENASVIFNGVTQASFHYAPYNFRTINKISAWGSLGSINKAAWHYGGGQSSVWVAGNHSAAASTTKYEMIDLGALSLLNDSSAFAINNAGLVLFGDDNSRFFWKNGKVRPFKNQGYTFGVLNDLNQMAGVKVINSGKPFSRAALWQNGKITQLGVMGKNGLWPSSINNKGQIVGLTAVAYGGWLPAVWEKGHVRILKTPEEDDIMCGAYDINASGQIVGVADVHDARHAYLWQAEKGIDLGVLPTCTQSEGLSINDKGHVVGLSYGPDGWDTHKRDLRSFIWKNGVMRDLGSVLGGNRINACCINNNDEVVGYARRADGYIRGFVLKNGKVTDLGVLPKCTDSYATSINDNGWIIGYATMANGKNHAILWRPIIKAK
jgi:probable HAF family extracellular repeat protein